MSCSTSAQCPSPSARVLLSDLTARLLPWCWDPTPLSTCLQRVVTSAFAEPTGKSLQRHQAEIKHVEELMDRSSLNFLYGANVKTATEASLRASQVASSVSALIRNKTQPCSAS